MKFISDNGLIKFINHFRENFYGNIGSDYDELLIEVRNNYTEDIDEPVEILDSFNVWTLDELVKVLESLDNDKELCLNIEKGYLLISNDPQNINVLETDRVLGHIRWNIIGKGLSFLSSLRDKGYDLIFEYACSGTSGKHHDFGINFKVIEKCSKEVVGYIGVYKGVIHKMSEEIEKILGIKKGEC